VEVPNPGNTKQFSFSIAMSNESISAMLDQTNQSNESNIVFQNPAAAITRNNSLDALLLTAQSFKSMLIGLE